MTIFCPVTANFGRLRPVDPADVPPVPRGLLDHGSHMTVAMERHHGGAMTLRVVATAPESAADDGRGGLYAREILLLRSDGTVVQHGIVRIDLGRLPAAIAATVRAGHVPLGRVLIEAGTLCAVQNVRLLAVSPGPHLAALWGGATGETFGRVAEISIDGRPGIELLEIVVPALR